MTDVTIFVGTVFGGARATADAVASALTELNLQARVLDEPTLADLGADSSAILICTSTTGQGEMPANILPFYAGIRDTLPLQPGRPFGIIVLGDSNYGETFCGAGDLLEEAFYELACDKIGETLRIDASETSEPEAVAIPWSKAWAEAVLAL